MKRSTLLSSLWLLILIAIVSCKKDNLEQTAKATPSNWLSTERNAPTTPVMEHGMLSFTDYSHLYQFTKYLQKQESDTETVLAAYQDLGFDVSSEPTTNPTAHPICKLVESNLGLHSLRAQEEAVIIEQLNNGEDVFSLIDRPYLKSVLNEYGSVHAGGRIYRFWDNGLVAIIPNDDWELYESIKELEANEIHTQYNLLLTSKVERLWKEAFFYSEDGYIVAERPLFVPRIYVVETENGLAVKNLSVIEGSPTYQWHLADGTTWTGTQPNSQEIPHEVSIGLIDGGGETITVSAAACEVQSSFTITDLGNGRFRFEAAPWNAPGGPYWMQFVFSDGVTLVGNPVEREITGTVDVTCQVLRNHDNSVACQWTLQVSSEIDCGIKRRKNETWRRTVNGQRWKIDGQIWVEDNEIGCKMRYLRRRWGIWLPANNAGVRTSFNGTYKRETDTGCDDVSSSDSYGLGQGTWPISISVTKSDAGEIFREANAFSASHRLNIQGTWWGPGLGSIPRQVLD